MWQQAAVGSPAVAQALGSWAVGICLLIWQKTLELGYGSVKRIADSKSGNRERGDKAIIEKKRLSDL